MEKVPDNVLSFDLDPKLLILLEKLSLKSERCGSFQTHTSSLMAKIEESDSNIICENIDQTRNVPLNEDVFNIHPTILEKYASLNLNSPKVTGPSPDQSLLRTVKLEKDTCHFDCNELFNSSTKSQDVMVSDNKNTKGEIIHELILSGSDFDSPESPVELKERGRTKNHKYKGKQRKPEYFGQKRDISDIESKKLLWLSSGQIISDNSAVLSPSDFPHNYHVSPLNCDISSSLHSKYKNKSVASSYVAKHSVCSPVSDSGYGTSPSPNVLYPYSPSEIEVTSPTLSLNVEADLSDSIGSAAAFENSTGSLFDIDSSTIPLFKNSINPIDHQLKILNYLKESSKAFNTPFANDMKSLGSFEPAQENNFEGSNHMQYDLIFVERIINSFPNVNISTDGHKSLQDIATFGTLPFLPPSLITEETANSVTKSTEIHEDVENNIAAIHEETSLDAISLDYENSCTCGVCDFRNGNNSDKITDFIYKLLILDDVPNPSLNSEDFSDVLQSAIKDVNKSLSIESADTTNKSIASNKTDQQKLGFKLKRTARNTLIGSKHFSKDKYLSECFLMYKQIKENEFATEEKRVIHYLKENGKYSRSNLHEAVMTSNLEKTYCIVEIHKQYHKSLFDINSQDSEFQTALDYAVKMGIHLLINYLEENNAVRSTHLPKTKHK